MKKLIHKFLCFIGDHEWTCKAAEGIKPSGFEIPQDDDSQTLLMLRFHTYAAMYCEHCKQTSKWKY